MLAYVVVLSLQKIITDFIGLFNFFHQLNSIFANEKYVSEI